MMKNENILIEKINNQAVFAQLDILTDGTTYDEGRELFRVDSHGNRLGNNLPPFTLDGLKAIGRQLFDERKNSGLSPIECGGYKGFAIKLIYAGGYQTRFFVDVNFNTVSPEYDGWRGGSLAKF